MKSSAWLAALALGMAAVAVVEELRIAGLREQLAVVKRDGPAPIAAAGNQSAAAEPTRPTRVIVPDRADRAPTRTDRQPDAADAADAADSPAESMQKSLRKMAENPAGRAMMNQGVRAMAGVWYASLIGDLGLNDTERDYFLDLIGGGFSRQQELGMKLMSAKDEAERTAIQQEIAAAEQAQKDSVKEFLNDDEDYQRFVSYQERLPEYQQLDALRAVMKDSNAPLTPEQEAKVVDAMFTARTTTPDNAQWQGGPQGLAALNNEDFEQRFEEYWATASQHAATEVGKVLDGPQLDAFRRYQDQVKEMQLLGLKMAAQMFRQQGNESPPGNPPAPAPPSTPPPAPE